MAISGNRAAIADRSRNSVFIYNTTTWQIEDVVKPTGAVPSSYWFGASVDLDGDHLVVGAVTPTAFGPRSGHVFSYDLATHTQVELVPQQITSAVYGMDVDVDGNLVAVGANNGDSVGRFGTAELFDVRTGKGLGTVPHPEQHSGSDYGFALGLDGNQLVVGDWLQSYRTGSTFQDRAGRLYLFTVPEPSTASIGMLTFLLACRRYGRRVRLR
jgi:hypothetical protein